MPARTRSPLHQLTWPFPYLQRRRPPSGPFAPLAAPLEPSPAHLAHGLLPAPAAPALPEPHLYIGGDETTLPSRCCLSGL